MPIKVNLATKLRNEYLKMLQKIGEWGIEYLNSCGRSGIMLFHACFGIPSSIIPYNLFIKEIYKIGVLSLPIIVVSAAFVGMVLSLQGWSILKSFSAESAVGQLVALSLLRELGPVVTALLFAGRAGSAISAEISLMKTTEQLSSMEMMGVDPLHHVIAPRIWAGIFTMPILAIIFNIVGISAGAFVAVEWLGVYEGSYWGNMQETVHFHEDIINGIIKSVVFAFVIAWIATFQGYNSLPTAEGIGNSTTKTVVYSSLAILGLDFLLTALMFSTV